MKHIEMPWALIACIIGLSACGEPGTDKQEPGSPQEILQHLTNGDYKDWRLEKATYYKVDVSSQLPECQRDEIFRFYANGKGEVRSGKVACRETEPEVQATGNWQLNPTGDTMLVEWQQKAKWEIAINKLAPDQLVTTGEVFDNYEVTATFSPLNKAN